MPDSDSDLEPELLGDIAKLQEEIDQDAREEDQQIETVNQVIAANVNLHAKLQSLMLFLHQMLAKTQVKLRENRAEILRASLSCDTVVKLKPRQLGAPYFRDSSDRPPPPNIDTLMKKQLGMVNCFELVSSSGWTRKDKDHLQKEILKQSRESKIEDLESQLAELRRKTKNKTDKTIGTLAENVLLKEIKKVSKASLPVIAYPLHKEYDWDTIAYNMEYRHKATELRAMWRLHLHPLLRQGNLSRVEHCLLKNLCEQYAHQNWEQISNDLGGRRSAYQCFVMYRTTISDNYKGIKWTPEEDEFLKQNIEFYRIGNYIPWGTISSCFENKTKIQIYNRYIKRLKPELRKGKFLPEEDAVMLAAYNHHGPNFKKISQYLPGRDICQVRQRFKLSLTRAQPSAWTVEDDRKLLHFVNAMKNDSINYADAAKHFPDRNRASVRIRYLVLTKWMRSHPNSDIGLAPRREPRTVKGPQVEQLDLRTAVDQLVSRLDTEQAHRPQNVKEVSLDEAILNVYIKHIKEEDKFKSINFVDEEKLLPAKRPTNNAAQQPEHDVKCMRTLLLLLKANLDPATFKYASLSEKYSDLQNEDPIEFAPPKIKTYTRKVKAEPPQPPQGAKVTVWNNTKSYKQKYVLPPNYQILCACKTLLQEAYRQSKFRRSLSLVRTSALKTNYEKLVERCEIVLTWGLALSNTPATHVLKSIRKDSQNEDDMIVDQ